jgi:flagellar basal body-associated protein FliL
MNYKDTIKKILVGLIIIVAVAAAGTLIASLFMKSDTSDNANNTNVNKLLNKVDVPMDVLPSKFPTDLPVEEGATIKENSQSKTQNGTESVTRTFESTKTLATNFTTYSNYMKNNGWEVQNQINDADYKMISAQKGGQLMQVTMNIDQFTKKNVITITVTDI